MTGLADALIAAGDAGDVAVSLADMAVWFVLGPQNLTPKPLRSKHTDAAVDEP